MNEQYLRMLQWRGIDADQDTICRSCDGAGVATYANTSTWRGGVGGSMVTSDVCDMCWGSGASNRPWTNLRKLK